MKLDMRRHGMFLAGLGIVLAMSALALLAPWIAPFDPAALDLDHILMPPSSEHLLGTDALGRDVFSRLLYGARVSLWVGFVAVGISTAIGIVLGLSSGYFGGIDFENVMEIIEKL